MNVVEIFSSIEGEGIRAGELCTFIRLAGCNLRCSYCDTPYAQNDYDGNEMSVTEIVERCQELHVTNITVTGGEPLIHKDIEKLLEVLIVRGFKVNVETNGSVAIAKYKISPAYSVNLFFTMDYKCNSSGMNFHMECGCISPYRDLDKNDVLKFVVGNEEDMKQCLAFRHLSCYKYLSPVYGEIELEDIVTFMKANDLQDFRLQVQLHKIIYPVDMRGV